MTIKPGLFGLHSTNRDFTTKEAWGKNQFNSSFPASLCCYLASKGHHANYLSINNGSFTSQFIKIDDVFGISPDSDDIYFAFESLHTPFQKYVTGLLPRIDLVIQRKSDGMCLSGLEVKLTALPDNTTCELSESSYGSEIVVRPDSIVYLACSIASSLQDSIKILIPDIFINDWTRIDLAIAKANLIIETIENISVFLENTQKAFLLQPTWKTNGKSPQLADNCLDVFIWSNAGFCKFISNIANNNLRANRITRQTRTAIWLFKMLLEIKQHGSFNHKKIIDELSYNTKNDKAFASSGIATNKYMKCSRLVNPIISKSEIKNIILGGGQNLLSPERRFDAIVFNSPELFN